MPRAKIKVEALPHDQPEQAYRELVGLRLRQVIEALGISQADAARKMGISASHLGNWLRGENYPNPWRLKPFLDRYSVAADWIYRGHLGSMRDTLGDALEAVVTASRAAVRERASQEPEQTKSSSKRRPQKA